VHYTNCDDKKLDTSMFALPAIKIELIILLEVEVMGTNIRIAHNDVHINDYNITGHRFSINCGLAEIKFRQ